MTALNPFEIDAALKQHGGLAMIAILTTQTCGEPCWHAREEICRCSCGGRNHGCLRSGTGQAPERTSKIDGYVYRLKAIGRYTDIVADAVELNRLAGWKSVDKPSLVIDGMSKSWTPEEITAARLLGREMWWSQYKYTWATTDHGAPARLKTASKSQRNWKELSGWKDESGVYLLWERMDKPDSPAILVVDKKTGEPLADQLPDYCFA